MFISEYVLFLFIYLFFIIFFMTKSCVYDHFYSMCDDNMDIITVLRDMIDVRDGFTTCAYYTNNNVEDVINNICLNGNVKLSVCFLIVPLFLLQCVNKYIIIIALIILRQSTKLHMIMYFNMI